MGDFETAPRQTFPERMGFLPAWSRRMAITSSSLISSSPSPPSSTALMIASSCSFVIMERAAPASSIVISPFEQRLHAAAQCFCYNHKAARLAFERLHLTSIGAGPCSHKLHSLAAARASDVLAVMHWNMSPSRNSQGGPLGPEISPSAGTLCNNRAN